LDRHHGLLHLLVVLLHLEHLVELSLVRLGRLLFKSHQDALRLHYLGFHLEVLDLHGTQGSHFLLHNKRGIVFIQLK